MSLSLLGGLRGRAHIRRRCLPKLVLPDDDDAIDEAGSTSAEKQPHLPPDDNPGLEEAATEAPRRWKPCCKHTCTAKIEAEAAEAARSLKERLNREDKHGVVFELVKQSTCARGKIRLFGFEVCQRAFCNVLDVSAGLVLKHKRALETGFYNPQEDQRAHNGSNNSHLNKQLHADAFFHYLDAHVAEPLANEDLACQEIRLKSQKAAMCEWTMARDGNPLAQAAVGLTTAIDRRFLPYMAWTELFEMYQHHGNEAEERAGRSCFDKVFKDKWKDVLHIRGIEQHARCDQCAELLKRARGDPDPQVRADARKAYDAHINQMILDRTMDARITRLSELATMPGYAYSGVLHVRIDGMDQAKFKIPRQLENAKAWGQIWRPTLHTLGIIVEGLFEIFLIMDMDIPKDSNMQCTALTYALDVTAKELARRGLPMPQNLSIKFDNTPREGKNQHLVKYEAWLVGMGVFRSVQDSQGEKGHTHDSLDQRFSVVATLLSSSMILQTPGDFVKQIRKRLAPARGRLLIVDVLQATWDWQSFFDALNFSVAGVAPTFWTPDTCHCKRPAWG